MNAVAFGGLGRDLVTGAVDGSLTVTRDAGATLELTASGAIDVAELLPDGRLIAADAQRRLRIYDVSGAILADEPVVAQRQHARRQLEVRTRWNGYREDERPAARLEELVAYAVKYNGHVVIAVPIRVSQAAGLNAIAGARHLTLRRYRVSW